LFWNARNDYSKPYVAMPVMAKEPVKYFRGDEHNKIVVETAAAVPAGK
jgi:hypothetical protein